MGCGTSTQSETSANIDQMMRATAKENEKCFRLLLLGAGESGKSTFAKQIKYIHLNGFSTEEKLFFKDTIIQNVLYAIQTVIQACIDMEIDISESTQEKIDVVLDLGIDDFSPSTAKIIKKLYHTDEIQEAQHHYSKYHQLDSSDYLLTNVSKFAESGYIPDRDDILHCRVKSLGVQELHFTIEENKFIIVDVGGQRSERRKWIKCFAGITGIIFFVAISAFDLSLYEDPDTNRMHEALELFQDICNTRMFDQTPIILFLNKTDKFREKIESGAKITTAFPDYSGPHTYDDCSDYIQTEFLSRNFNPDKAIFSHFVCALDEDNIRLVFNSVKNIVLQGLINDNQL